MLNIQFLLNNRPLTYCEDDIEMPLQTPSLMIFGKSNYLLNEDPSDIEPGDLRKRAKYIMKCKEALWERWYAEYLKALRERNNNAHSGKRADLRVGDVVLIKGDEKNRAHWKIAIVHQLIQGRDNEIRAVKLKAGKSFLDHPIRFLYPMELHCDEVEQVVEQPKPKDLNVQA